jgi:hypothetical protein
MRGEVSWRTGSHLKQTVRPPMRSNVKSESGGGRRQRTARQAPASAGRRSARDAVLVPPDHGLALGVA